MAEGTVNAFLSTCGAGRGNSRGQEDSAPLANVLGLTAGASGGCAGDEIAEGSVLIFSADNMRELLVCGMMRHVCTYYQSVLRILTNQEVVNIYNILDYKSPASFSPRCNHNAGSLLQKL